jgi:hypothetical protein
MPESAKKLIEQKKTRLEGLVRCQQIKYDYAQKLLKEFAQFVCRYYGC